MNAVKTDQPDLTYTQQSVLELLVLGMSNAEIANTLELSIKTIKAHLTAIYRRTNCGTARKLIATYYGGNVARGTRCPGCGSPYP